MVRAGEDVIPSDDELPQAIHRHTWASLIVGRIAIHGNDRAHSVPVCSESLSEDAATVVVAAVKQGIAARV